MIQIGGAELLLGEIFEQAVQKLSQQRQFQSFGGWENFRCAWPSLWKIPTLLTEIRAPYSDRPILQQSFELAAADHSELRSQARAVLGLPYKENNFTVKHSSQVSSTLEWQLENCQVTLSMYGGPRKVENGFSTAGLFISIMDETDLAQPYLAAIEALESSLWGNGEAYQTLASFSLEQNTRPFGRAISSETQGLATTQSKAKKALYKRGLLNTPDFILNMMGKHDVVIWQINDRFFISAPHDTVQFDPALHPVESILLKPAKGSGRLTLQVSDLTIEAAHNSKSLRALMDCLVALGGSLHSIEEFDA